jgi:hypothetical protein
MKEAIRSYEILAHVCHTNRHRILKARLHTSILVPENTRPFIGPIYHKEDIDSLFFRNVTTFLQDFTPFHSIEFSFCKKKTKKQTNKQTAWPEFASELHRPSGRSLPTKLVATFANKGCHVVSVTDPYVRNPGFLEGEQLFFFQVAPNVYSRG